MTPQEFKQLRLDMGLSQRKLAKILRLDHKTVHRWENGDCKITFMTELAMQRLEQVMGMREA